MNRHAPLWLSLIAGIAILGMTVSIVIQNTQVRKSESEIANLVAPELDVLSGIGTDSSQPASEWNHTTLVGKNLKTERAVLAGGCFWGMEDLFRRLPGVVSTRVGYTGGDVPNATYGNHGSHAEAIEVVYDPSKTDFRKLLEFFFQVHDPTTKNRQGNDRGTSYRSAIYFTSDKQKEVALDTIADVNASGIWPGKVVTELEPASDFWEAEPEHQDYLQRTPGGYTCHFPRKDWVLPKR